MDSMKSIKLGKKNFQYLVILVSFLLCDSKYLNEHPIPINALQENPCADLSIGGCTVDEGLILETITDISQEECQAVCAVVYKEKCNFFTFDLTTQQCEIVSQKFDEFVDSCTKIAAPPLPNIKESLDSNDPCKVNPQVNMNF